MSERSLLSLLGAESFDGYKSLPEALQSRSKKEISAWNLRSDAIDKDGLKSDHVRFLTMEAVNVMKSGRPFIVSAESHFKSELGIVSYEMIAGYLSCISPENRDDGMRDLFKASDEIVKGYIDKNDIPHDMGLFRSVGSYCQYVDLIRVYAGMMLSQYPEIKGLLA